MPRDPVKRVASQKRASEKVERQKQKTAARRADPAYQAYEAQRERAAPSPTGGLRGTCAQRSAQRGTFKGVWLNTEQTEWALQKV
jgi:hypothetical protein